MADGLPPVPQRLQVGRFLGARDKETQKLIGALEATGVDAAVGVDANPRHLRRRTTAYKRYGHSKRRLNTKKASLAAKQGEGVPGKDTKPGDAPPSFQNRAMRRRKARMLQNIIESRRGPPDSQPVRLETHMWHAKRMAMTSRWGCILAEGATGRGHASRSVLQKLREGSLVHDASYWQPFCLQGRLGDLLQLLSSVSDPDVAGALRRDRKFLAGEKEVETVLHHSGCFPRGAIGPSPLCLAPWTQPGRSPQPFFDRERRLWLWAHPAASLELEAAFTGIAAQLNVTFANRRGALLRMEVCGTRSDEVISAALSLPEDSGSEADTHGVFHADEAKWRRWLASGEASWKDGKEGKVLHLRAKDPRLARPSALTPRLTIPTAAPESVSDCLLVADGLPTAMTEQQVSSARHHLRTAELTRAEFQPDDLQAPQECPIVPVMTVSRGRKPGGCPHWTIVCPRSWGTPLWAALLFSGAHAAGLREWGWAALQAGRPTFPQDYPDTSAARQHEAALAAEDDAQRGLRPKGKFPDRASPDWQRLACPDALDAATHTGSVPAHSLGEPAVMEVDDVPEPSQPSSASLLPQGCFVARTLSVMEPAVLPLRLALPEPAAGISARKAEQALMAWQAKQGGNRAAPQQGGSAEQGLSRAPAGGQCLVLVTLRFRFTAGTAETGAAVLDGGGGGCSVPAAGESSEEVVDGAVLGYVTSGEVRGLSGRSGAIAACRADLLLGIRARDGSGRGHCVKVLVRNPRSPNAHKAEATIMLEARR